MNIAHRDIKLDNILLAKDRNGEIQVKLIDFGCATYYFEGEPMGQGCGSIFYMAPEVFFNYYTEKCDVWSIGIITFACLFGRFPFDDHDMSKIEEKVLSKKLSLSREEK